jgi:hypothetical protein
MLRPGEALEQGLVHLERAALLSGMSAPSTALALRAYIDELGAPGDPAGHLAAWGKLRAGSLVDLVGQS